MVRFIHKSQIGHAGVILLMLKMIFVYEGEHLYKLPVYVDRILFHTPPPSPFLFFDGRHDGNRVRSCCAGWRTLTPHKENDRITSCEYGKAPTRQLHSNTYCCLWIGHTRKQSKSLELSSTSKKVGTRCRSPFYERFLEGCNSPFVRLAGHPTSLRAWCKQCLSSW